MTLPLTTPTPVRPVRCEGLRASGLRCNRWLRDAESIAARMGPDCRERAGLVPPRRHRFSVVESVAADAPLFEINKGDNAMMVCICLGCGTQVDRPVLTIERTDGFDGGGGIPVTSDSPEHLCVGCARFVIKALADRKKTAA